MIMSVLSWFLKFFHCQTLWKICDDDSFVAHFPESVPVNEFEDPLRIDKVIYMRWCATFWDTV